MCLHCIGKVTNCSIKSCSRSWSAHEGTINEYTKAQIGKKWSKFSQLSFCQKLFFLNQTPSCTCSMCIHCEDKVSNCSIKWWGGGGGGLINFFKKFIRNTISVKLFLSVLIWVQTVCKDDQQTKKFTTSRQRVKLYRFFILFQNNSALHGVQISNPCPDT